MARINNRPSEAHSSTYHTATPTPGLSDQENRDPDGEPRRIRNRKEKEMPSRGSLPTPTSGASTEGRSQKRKRTDDRHDESDSVEERFTRYFDPNQDPEIRREIKKKSRALERDFNENRDELLRNNDSGLTDTVHRANRIFDDIKQTNDATLDSRLLVNVSDLAYKKTAQLVLGDSSTGIDVDEFLSKCITFMRNGGASREGEEAMARPQRQTRTRDDSDDDDDDDDDPIGEALDWELLGRHACFPSNARPPVPSFLLGPLSVQKKQRTQTQRRARAENAATKESRPQALTREEIDTSDDKGLTAICNRLHRHLSKLCDKGQRALGKAGITNDEELRTPEGQAVLDQYGITAMGGPNLFKYTINPHSFGQTVENLFYVSFLIKEGTCGLYFDNDGDGMPSLVAETPHTAEEHRNAKNNIVKRQSILSIDYQTWKDFIEAYDIKESMIPHREDEQMQVGATGWYT